MAKASGPAADAFPCPAKTGWLTKEGGSGGSWQKRWMVLDHHYLFYYKTKDGKHPQSEICLADYDHCTHATDCKKSPYAFKISSSQITNEGQVYRTYMMYAESEAEMQDWIDAVQREMNPGCNSVVLAPSDKSPVSAPSPSPFENKDRERSPSSTKFPSLLNRFRGVTASKKDKKESKPAPPVSIDKKALDVVSTEAKAGPTLIHLTADRSRGQQRRPPTRQRRQQDANAAPSDLVTDREITSDRPEPLLSDRPEPPPKRNKPALLTKPPSKGEISPSSRPKVAIKPPLIKSKEDSQDPLRKPTPLKPKRPARTPSDSSLPLMETPIAKPKPVPRKRGKESSVSEPPNKPDEGIAPIEELPEQQENKMETEEADGEQMAVTAGAEQESSAPSAEVPKKELDDNDVIAESAMQQKEDSSEKEPSETLDEESEQEETKSSPEAETKQIREEDIDSAKGEVQSNGLNGPANIELAEKLGYVVVRADEEKETDISVPEDQPPTDVTANVKEELKQLESASADNGEVEAMKPAEVKTEEESEVKTSAEEVVDEIPKVLEPNKRISQVIEPNSPPKEEKPANKASESATSAEQVKLEAEEPKTLDSAQQIEQAAAKLNTLSDNPTTPQPVPMMTLTTSKDKDTETLDVAVILQSVSDPKAALEKAKEILRRSHKARIDTERALREAMLERELARKERADAEMMKKNATEILRLARAALSSIKK